MANAVKYLSRAKDGFSLGSKQSAWPILETVKNSFESPGSGNLVLLTADLNPQQQPERLESDAKEASTRAAKPTFVGPMPHGSTPFEMEIRPPGQLTGTDTIMGADILKAIIGASRIVNTQTSTTINAVNSHGRSYTEVDITSTFANWNVGDGVALRSQAANALTSGPADGDIRLVTAVTDLGAGSVRLKCEPGFRKRPIAASDKVQGGVVWYPDDSLPWDNTFSLLMQDGFDAIFGSGGCFPEGTLDLDNKSLLKVQSSYNFKAHAFASEDQVKGDAATDTFLTTDTVLRVGDARKFTAGAFVNLKKVTVATDAVAGTETKATVQVVDTTNNKLTLLRGTSPVSSTDLTAQTSTQEVAETYDLTTKKILRLNLDNQGDIDIDLTLPTAPSSSSAATAAEVVANINATLRDAKLYGQNVDSPYSVIDWGTGVASVVATKVRLTSLCFGSQSRIKVTDTGLASSAHDRIFSGAFDISATDEIQIIPWTPGGSVSVDPISCKDGVCVVDGYVLKGSKFNAKFSNEAEWIEDVKNGLGIPEGFIPGLRRKLESSWTIPAYGWASRIRAMALADESSFFVYQVGTVTGKSFAIIIPKAKYDVPQKQGANRRDFTANVHPEERKSTNPALKDFYLVMC